MIHRLQRGIRRPLLWFGIMELAIGAAALAIPGLMALSRTGLVHLFGGAGLDAADDLGTVAYSFGSTAVALLIPTSLMGATLPLLARYAILADHQIGTRTGLLYMANTLGAAVGTIGAAFVLLPSFGLDKTVYFGVATNVTVCLAALALHALSDAKQSRCPNRLEQPTAPAPPSVAFRMALPIAGLSGFIGFSYEIVWTRLVTPVLGGTIFAFASMLGTYLFALAIGSGLAALIGKFRWNPRTALAWSVLFGAMATLVGLAAASPLLAWVVERGHAGDWSKASWFGAKIIWAGVVVLPGAIPLGTAFPLCIRLLAHKAGEALTACSRVFVWNTIGAVCGATVTGLWLLPALKFAGTVGVLSTLGLGIGVCLAVFARPVSKPLIGGVVVTACLLVGFWPSSPWEIIRFAPLQNRIAKGKLRFYEVGRTTTVTAMESPFRDWRLHNDGLPESSIQPPGARFGRYALARWLSLLPAAIRPDIRDMLIVGLGGGIVIEELPETATTVDVVEIEKSVLDMNRYFGPRRRKDPLSDRRVSIHIGDARSSLLLADHHFDTIVSQPSHPFTSGGAQLYTREFFQLASSRLNDDGVFVQWMGLQFVSEELLRSLIGTVCSTFPYVDIYQPPPGGAILLMASNRPLEYDSEHDIAIHDNKDQWERLGIFSPTDLRAVRVARTEQLRRLSENAPLISDGHNILQLQSPWTDKTPVGNQRATSLFLDSSDPESSGDYTTALSIARQGSFKRTQWHADRLSDPGQRSIITGIAELYQRRYRKALRQFEIALSSGHVRPELIQGLAIIQQQSALRGRIPPAFNKVLQGNAFPGARAVTEAWKDARGTNGWERVQTYENRNSRRSRRTAFCSRMRSG